MRSTTMDARSAVAPVTSTPAILPLEKPLLRGVSHQIAFFAGLVATGLLVHGAGPGVPTLAALVFGGAMCALFGTSALYHRRTWGEVGRMRMRRLDHAAIFLLIGGGYTPLFALIPSRAGGHGALIAIWAGAVIGMIKSIAWPRAPKWVAAVLAVGIGWMVVGQVVDRAATLGTAGVWLLVVAGATYSAGAAVYATKRPDPVPRVFGYHEVFHMLVIAATAMVFAHVVLVLRAT